MRPAYKVFGLIDSFAGRLFCHGQTERFTAQSYCAFLATVLASTDQPLILIQYGAKYHAAAATKEFVAAHADRLSVYQLPSYSPDYNPIEHLWKNMKHNTTHNRCFPEFAGLCVSLKEGLAYIQAHPAEVKQQFRFNVLAQWDGLALGELAKEQSDHVSKQLQSCASRDVAERRSERRAWPLRAANLPMLLCSDAGPQSLY